MITGIYDTPAKGTLLGTSTNTIAENSPEEVTPVVGTFLFSGVTLTANTPYYFELTDVVNGNDVFLWQWSNHYADGIYYNSGIERPTFDAQFLITYTDIAAPTLQSSSPADNATAVAVGTNIVLTFSEAVDVETGNIIIRTTVGDTTVETIDVTGGLVTGTGTTAITVNPTSDLANNTEYYVLIDATAFDDAASNSYAGIASTTALSFTVASQPNPLDDERVVELIQAQTQTVVRVADQAIGTVNNRLSQLIVTSKGKDKTTNNSYQGIKLVTNLDPNVDSALLQSGLLSGLNSSGDLFHNGWAVWTEGSVILGKSNGRSDFRVEGMTVGIDKRITPSLTAGLAFRAAQGDIDVGATEKVDTDAYSATVYGSYILTNDSYIQGALGYSDIDFSTERTDDIGTLSGNRDADQVYLSLSFTRQFEYRGLTLLPYGSFDGSYSTLDSYSETGTGAALTYHEQDVRTLAATIGLRGRYFIQQSNGSFIPRFHIHYQGDINSDNDAKVSYVSVPSTTYSSSFDAISSSSWLFGLGFDYQYNNLNFSADYERTQEINWGYSDAFRLKLEVTF